MRITAYAALALACAGLLALNRPAFSQSIPKPKPHHAADAKSKAHARVARKDLSNRLVSFAVKREPKRPPLGWPALVAEARKYMGTNPTDRKRLWCATFMNMVLAKAGYKGTNSDAAKSFAQYGHRISQPKVGAIAVLTRGRTGGHVGVVSGIDADGNPIVISGNHGRKVGEATYPRSRVIAYVMPSETGAHPMLADTRGAGDKPASDRGLDSPITELLAAIDAEQNRANDSRAEHPRQVPAQRRDLPLDPDLARLLGIKQPASSPARSG